MQHDPLMYVDGFNMNNYADNNPLKYIDAFGMMNIFINGYNALDDLNYGGPFKGAYNNNNFREYWNGIDDYIVKMTHDNKRRYYDGSPTNPFSTAIERFNTGYKQGLRDAKRIKNQLGCDECVRVWTHSMGAAFGKGFVAALREEHVNVCSEVDMAPYQARELGNSGLSNLLNDVPTTQMAHWNDPLNSTKRRMYSSDYSITWGKDGGIQMGHDVKSFKSDLENYFNK